MKQKYKVFINDQEIVFRSKITSERDEINLISHELSPTEVYRQLSNESLTPGTYVFETANPEKEFRKFIDQFKLIEAAGGIVRKENESGDLLVIFRLGKWDLPKGKIDDGESPEFAAIREVEEECGISGLIITGKVADTFHLYERKGKILLKMTYWYSMITSDKTTPLPQEDEGIEEVRWVNQEQLLKLLPQAYTSIKSLIDENILNS